MPILLLLVIFIVVPLVELYVIVTVADSIGVVPTLLLLAIDSIVGSLLLKSQGRAVWLRFNETMAAGRVPHREVLDGVMVIFGGAFLITPGFLTDIVGIILLIPPTRAVVRRLVARRLGRRVVVGSTSRRSPRGRFDVEGTASEYDDTTRGLER
ncbi:MAG TPA: FxsA family protein [Thermoleophilaceae bacterium]|nr:FxsA family protein [Thermoleophilaceae bacterium]